MVKFTSPLNLPESALGSLDFGTEQAKNAKVYRALSAHSYSDAAHISLSITGSCPASIKHSNLQLPRDSSVAVPHIQRLIPKGRKRPYDESPELLFQNFPRGVCPQTPLERYPLYAHRNCPRCARRMAAPRTLNVCPPSLLKTLDPPLLK